MDITPRPRLERLARALLRLGVAGCFAVTAWLVVVLALVVPARDPGGVPFWLAVTAGFLCLGGLGAWHLARPRLALVRWAVGLLALVALALGSLALMSQVNRASDGGEFEGYLVLMGAVLAGLGVAAFLHLFATRRRRRAEPRPEDHPLPAA